MYLEQREISERLTEALASHNLPYIDNLKPALALACTTLEAACPAVMGMTPQGFIGTLATTIPAGTWQILLANQTKVFTIELRFPKDHPFTWKQFLTEAVANTRAEFSAPLADIDVMLAVNLLIKKHGLRKNQKGKHIHPVALLRSVGLLFAAHTQDQIANVALGVTEAIAHNVCPLHVGLVGKASNGKPGAISGAWPIGLPFAPYADSLGI